MAISSDALTTAVCAYEQAFAQEQQNFAVVRKSPAEE
jgi:hypothetical protein